MVIVFLMIVLVIFVFASCYACFLIGCGMGAKKAMDMVQEAFDKSSISSAQAKEFCLIMKELIKDLKR